MKVIISAAAALLLLTVPQIAEAASGVVVFNKSGCRGRYVVETTMGYAILEWFGGHDPLEGERIQGDFESYGMKEIYFGNSREGKVWLEDYWLSRSRAQEKLATFCD